MTRNFLNYLAPAGAVVAAICHGGWIPISAGVYRGVRVTGSPGIKDDLVNAGAVWEDAAVVVDRHFVSSRKIGPYSQFQMALYNLLRANFYPGYPGRTTGTIGFELRY